MRAIRFVLIPLLLAVAPIDAFALFGQDAKRMDRCVTSLGTLLPEEVNQALGQIDGNARKLLALRSYVRNERTIEGRWSWSAQQIARYEGSAEQRKAQEELARIVKRFEDANPGYTLYVNTQVRSLDTQLRRWNENESVGKAAHELERAAYQKLPRDGCAGLPSKESFVHFLSSWQPSHPPTLAAPGLSKHGQGRAFDFQVKRGDLIVAGTDSARSVSSWDKNGWTRKLRAAVSAGSERFSGPLTTPYEPWHYEFRP